MTGWNVIFSGPYTAGTAQEEAAGTDDTVAGQGALPGAEKIHIALWSNNALCYLLEKVENVLNAINGKRRKRKRPYK
jgi:hypothetical protein